MTKEQEDRLVSNMIDEIVWFLTKAECKAIYGKRWGRMHRMFKRHNAQKTALIREIRAKAKP